MNFFHRNAGFVVEDFITQNDLANPEKTTLNEMYCAALREFEIYPAVM